MKYIYAYIPLHYHKYYQTIFTIEVQSFIIFSLINVRKNSGEEALDCMDWVYTIFIQETTPSCWGSVLLVVVVPTRVQYVNEI